MFSHDSFLVHGIPVSLITLRNTMRRSIARSSSRFLFDHSAERHRRRLHLGGVNFSMPRHFAATLYQAIKAKMEEDSAASSFYLLFIIILFPPICDL